MGSHTNPLSILAQTYSSSFLKLRCSTSRVSHMPWISWIWFRPEAWHTKFSMVEKPILDRLQILNFYYKVGAGYSYTPPVLPSNPIFFWNSRDDKAVPTWGRSSMVMHARAAGDVLLFPCNVWAFYSSDLPGFYQSFINKSCFKKWTSGRHDWKISKKATHTPNFLNFL